MPDSWDIRMSMQRPAAPPPPGAIGPRRGPAPAPPSAASRRLVPVRRARRGSRTVMVLGFIAVVAVTAAAASIAWKLTTPEPSEPASSASVSEPGVPPPPAPEPTTTATARVSAPKPAPPPPPIPTDTAACFATMLPEKPFGHFKPKLDRLCTDTRAYNTMLYLKAAIVRAGGSMAVTPAMDEWSKLGWFETAGFAAMRAHCCPDAPALTTGSKLSRCKMEEALAYIANAVDDDTRMKEATVHYAEAARCIALAGGGYAWGRYSVPYGGEEVFFNRVYDRMKKARGR